jgi:hypothetical protein
VRVKHIAFWVAVAGAGAVLGPFALELAADKLPVPGLQRLVAYIHRGPNGGS